ncbi:SGS domain-containing protein [Fusarium flagelliforme]|uniref:Sgt1 and cs domain containing protein n=1 Tax=Fusarium flagelliforme TaxID=2675880 RepID=A0A395MUC9_9HYPO|nr:SGS domain-containing protein [Fusarium flagelliforme]KAH7191991.1 SGS domain-containing protein [Fusarium flagelliforme]RFN51472.1 hypothetical protein FIE12Z_4208 [Fusarium flagelliforme]
MSYTTLAQQGLAAAEARNWDEAIDKLTTALETSKNPLWLIARSKALINRKKFQEALDDANFAWHSAYERNKRPLLIEAHYRRAVAYFRLGQYANADACCIYAMRLVKGFPAVEKQDPARAKCDENGFYKVALSDAQEESKTDVVNNPGNKSALDQKDPPGHKEWRIASTLRMQILYAMEKLPEDDPARKLTTTIKPEVKELAGLSDLGIKKSGEDVPAAAATKPAVVDNSPPRIQEFQNNDTMSVSIFSKKVNKEKLQVKFGSDSVSLDSVVWPDGSEKPLSFSLWGHINTETSTYRVTPNKVELTLKKRDPGMWKQLKGEDNANPVSEKTESMIPAQEATKPVQAAKPPSEASSSPSTVIQDKGKGPAAPETATHPTSSKAGKKDWDNIGADIDSDEEKDVNAFFKKLYKGSNPEQQRAMMKSFIESNGTSLSTDWNDVKDRTVETHPPEGVEARKW